MVKTKREYILATAFTSGVAVIISIVGLATREWVTSPLHYNDGQSNHIKFGLFGGYVDQKSVFKTSYEVQMLCLFDKNVCALLCSQKDLEDSYHGILNSSFAYCGVDFQTRSFKPFLGDSNGETIRFINNGIRVSTITFLVISILFGVISTCLSVWNTTSNPYQVYFSIYGLYIYNAIAFIAILLTVVLWTSEYIKNIKEFVPTYLTIANGFTSKNMAKLGYSFWIQLISIFFYMFSIAILYVRNYLISKEPEVNVHVEDSSDGTMYLY